MILVLLNASDADIFKLVLRSMIFRVVLIDSIFIS